MHYRVRAGLNPDHSHNQEISFPSSFQAISGAVVDFILDPVVTAQYVSVDGGDSATNVHLTEVMVEEVRDSRMPDASRGM